MDYCLGILFICLRGFISKMKVEFTMIIEVTKINELSLQ